METAARPGGTAENISRGGGGRGRGGYDGLTPGDVGSLLADNDDDDDGDCWPPFVAVQTGKSHGDCERRASTLRLPHPPKSRLRDVTDDFIGDVIGDDLLPP